MHIMSFSELQPPTEEKLKSTQEKMGCVSRHIEPTSDGGHHFSIYRSVHTEVRHLNSTPSS